MRTLLATALLFFSVQNTSAWWSRSGLSIGAGDSRYVNVTGDTMSGNLRLAEQLIITGSVTFQNPSFSVGTSTLVVTGGWLGLGTNSPNAQLHIENANTAGFNLDTSNLGKPHIGFYLAGENRHALIQSSRTASGAGELRFITDDGTNEHQAITIADDGKVGINQANPSYGFHVSTGIFTSSDVIANAYHGDGSNLTGVAGGDPGVCFDYSGDTFASTATYLNGISREILKLALDPANYNVYIGSATTDSFIVRISSMSLGGTWGIIDSVTVPAGISSHTVSSSLGSMAAGGIISFGFEAPISATDPAGDITFSVDD